MRKVYAVISSTSLLMLTTPLKADVNICDVVLDRHTFNTYNNSHQEYISDNVGDIICDKHITSRKEADNQRANLQSGGQYEVIKGFFNAAAAKDGSSDEQTYDKLCVKHDRAFIKDLIISQKAQITDSNVAAWLGCVENTTKQGIFSALHASIDNKIFTVSIRYIKPQVEASPTQLKLIGIDDQLGFSCTVSGQSISDFIPEKNGLFGPFGVTCKRRSGSTNNVILINTSVGDVGPFDVPSKAFSDLSARVDALEAALSAAESRIVQKFKGELDEQGVQLTKTIQSMWKSPQKICSPLMENKWRAITPVPIDWTIEQCRNFAAPEPVAAGSYQLGCIFPDGSWSWGTRGGVGLRLSAPSPNCGW